MGFTKLKPKVAVVSGNDTFLSLPMAMGYGKLVVVSLLSWLIILTCNGKPWPIIAAAGVLELASFVVLHSVIVLMTLFYAYSAFLHPQNLGAC